MRYGENFHQVVEKQAFWATLLSIYEVITDVLVVLVKFTTFLNGKYCSNVKQNWFLLLAHVMMGPNAMQKL